MSFLTRERLLDQLRRMKMDLHRHDQHQQWDKRKHQPGRNSETRSHNQQQQRHEHQQKRGLKHQYPTQSDELINCDSVPDDSSRRRRQMIQSHISARRAPRPDLQTNLYRFLEDRGHRQNWPEALKAPAAEVAADKQCRRQLLMDAIGSLRRFPTLDGSASNAAQSCHPVVTSSQDESPANLRPPLLSNIRHQTPQTPLSDSGLMSQLYELSNSLRFLSIACRLKPSLNQTRANSSSGGCYETVTGPKLARKIEDTQRMVADMLRRCGGGRTACTPRPHTPDVGEPLFWCCPAHKELRSRRQCEKSSRQPPPSDGGRPTRRGDRVGGMVKRAKAALIGDPTFLVNSGREARWGKMTLPVSQPCLHNSADRIGRESLHRRRMRQRDEAAACAIDEFAECVEEK